jgi:hypothetical protein
VSTQTVTVTVTDVDDTKPLVTGPSGGSGAAVSAKSIPENTTAVHSFTANEPVTWSIEGGADAGAFAINPTTGALRFVDAPDFENPTDLGDTAGNNTYVVVIKATDANGNVSTQTVTITVTDVDDAKPIVTGPSGNAGAATDAKSIPENTTAVHSFTANEPVTWSIDGGADAGAFAIDPATGALRFVTAPDFENPTDIGDGVRNNTYVVVVKATDAQGNVSTQTVTVTITDIDEVPPTVAVQGPQDVEIIIDPTTGAKTLALTINEGLTPVADLGANEGVTWAIVGGANADLFQINADGELSLKNPGNPGVYTVVVTATDANGNTTTVTVTLTVASTLRIITESLPSHIVNKPGYSAPIEAVGGRQPYEWAIDSGALPDGLSIEASTGRVIGTPTKVGNFVFRAKVTDANGIVRRRDYSIRIQDIDFVPVLSLHVTKNPNPSSEAGAVMGDVVVTVKDQLGNVADYHTKPIRVTVTAGTGGPNTADAALFGTTTANPVLGVSTYTDLFMTRAGVAYTITATSEGTISGVSAEFNITPGPPNKLHIVEVSDSLAAAFDLVNGALGKALATPTVQANLTGNRIPLLMSVLDQYDNKTRVPEGDTPVNLIADSPTGRFFNRRVDTDSTGVVVIPVNTTSIIFYYEDPIAGTVDVDGIATPPPGARNILPGDTQVQIVQPNGLNADPAVATIRVYERQLLRVNLIAADGSVVRAPNPGVTITLSSSSLTGRFYLDSDDVAGVTSIEIPAALTASSVYYGDPTGGVHTITFTAAGLPVPTDQSVITVIGPTQYAVVPSAVLTPVGSTITVTAQLKEADGTNVPMAGQVVTWTATNGGSFSQATSLTNAQGLATISYTVSTTAAISHRITATDQASRTGQSVPVVTQTGNLTLMNLSSGDNQTQPVATLLAANLVVVLRDNFNNPVAGQTVTFRLVSTPDRATGVVFTNPDAPKALPSDEELQAGLEIRVVSDATGTADIRMVLGDIPGVYRVEASVAGLPPVNFNETALPGDYDLFQNFPNPADGSTTIRYQLPVRANVTLRIYDVAGALVDTPIDGQLIDAGTRQIIWDTSRFANGVYVYQIIARGEDGSRFVESLPLTIMNR